MQLNSINSNEKFSIRPYRESDWPAVSQVHDNARPDELRGSCDARAFVPLAEDADLADFNRSEKYVACLGERVVGFVGIDGSYLSWLYVNPQHYRKGIGRQLLRVGKETAGPKAWTIALAGNTPALELYKSEGFHVITEFDSNNAGYPCTVVRLQLNID